MWLVSLVLYDFIPSENRLIVLELHSMPIGGRQTFRRSSQTYHTSIHIVCGEILSQEWIAQNECETLVNGIAIFLFGCHETRRAYCMSSSTNLNNREKTSYSMEIEKRSKHSPAECSGTK